MESAATDPVLRHADDVLFQALDDEAVLLHLGSETYFGLNPVGARVWALIGELGTEGAICKRLYEEYETDEQTIARDVHALLGELLEAGLIVRS